MLYLEYLKRSHKISGSESGASELNYSRKLSKKQKMSHPRNLEYDLARVLLVDDDPASRLTLQTVLEAGGYNVDAAASAAEAVGKLDERQYELVLSDLQMESPDSGLKVIAHARMMDYKPATALITTYQERRSWSCPQSELALDQSGGRSRPAR